MQHLSELKTAQKNPRWNPKNLPVFWPLLAAILVKKYRAMMIKECTWQRHAEAVCSWPSSPQFPPVMFRNMLPFGL